MTYSAQAVEPGFQIGIGTGMPAIVIAALGAGNYGLLFLVFYGAPLIVPVADPFAGRTTSYWLFYSNARILSDLGLWQVYWIDVQSDVVNRRRRTVYIIWSIAVRFLKVITLIYAAMR